jgi:hypothetical protein
MSWQIAAGIRGALTKIAVPVALIAILPAVPAHAAPLGLGVPLDDLPTGPLDPRCATMPGYAACAGGPYWQGPPAPPAPPGLPTGPLDPQCATMPADAACVGSPYLPPPPPQLAEPPMPPPIAPPPIAPPPIEPPHIGGGMPGHI